VNFFLATPLFFLRNVISSSSSFKIKHTHCCDLKGAWQIDSKLLWQGRYHTGVDSLSAETDLAQDSNGDSVGDAILESRQPRRFDNLCNFWP
jgi:hypothetical protein